MFSGTGPTPDIVSVGSVAPLISAIQSNPAPRARSTNSAVVLDSSAVRRTVIGPLRPCAEPSKSRSVSMPRKCGSTSDQDQPDRAPALEIAGQAAAEVAAVDGPRAADHRAPHDVRRAPGVFGQRRLESPHQRAGRADRQHGHVGDHRANGRIDHRRAGFDDGDGASLVSRRPLRDNASGATRPDDQNVAVQRLVMLGSAASTAPDCARAPSPPTSRGRKPDRRGA